MVESRKPVSIPSDMKAFNRTLIGEHRANAGRLSGPMAGRSLLLLTISGARSGQPRTTVLAYGREGDLHVVIASNNGAPSPPAWYLNLLANPDEREELAKAVPYLESQQKLTSREIPLLILERVST